MPRKRKRRIIRDIEPRYLRQLSKVATVATVAHYCNVSIQTVHLWITQGDICAEKDGHIWLISLDSVVAFRGTVNVDRTINLLP